MNWYFKSAIAIFVLAAVPILIGLPLVLTSGNRMYIEAFLLLVGVVELLALNVRMFMRMRKRKKDPDRFKDEKEQLEYYRYTWTNATIIISGLFNIALSVIYFFIWGS